MFEKYTFEFKADEIVFHFEHVFPNEGTLPCATDANCTVCNKLMRMKRHVPEIKAIVDKPKKELK
jgi:hypothetical protein